MANGLRRTGRKHARSSKPGNDLHPLVDSAVPAPIAWAAFRAAIAADTKANDSKDPLDDCTLEYLGKIAQSVLSQVPPQRKNLSEALGPILTANGWEDARVEHACDTIWDASQKAAVKHCAQADGAKPSEAHNMQVKAVQQVAKARAKAVRQAQEALSEFQAQELVREEEKAERQKHQKLKKAEERRLKALEKVRADQSKDVEVMDSQSSSSSSRGDRSQSPNVSDTESCGKPDVMDSHTESGGTPDLDVILGEREPAFEISSALKDAVAEITTNKSETSSALQDLDCAPRARKPRGLMWEVRHYKEGVETVWNGQESEFGDFTDLRIVDRRDACPAVARTGSKKLSGSRASQSSKQGGSSTSKFLTLSETTTTMSDDSDPIKALLEDSPEELSELHQDIPGAEVAKDEHQRSPIVLSRDLGFEASDSSLTNVVCRAQDGAAAGRSPICPKAAFVPVSSARSSSLPPGLEPHDFDPEATMSWQASHLRGRGGVRSCSFSSPSTMPSSPNPVYVHPGHFLSDLPFPSISLAKEGPAGRVPRCASSSGGSDSGRSNAIDGPSPRFTQRKFSTCSLDSPWAKVQMWPSTPDASPWCRFQLPPPSQPLMAGVVLESADSLADPFGQLLEPGLGSVLNPATENLCPSMPVLRSGVDLAMLAPPNEADEYAEAQSSNLVDSHGPTQLVDSRGPTIIYVPVFMPHRCHNCGHECTAPVQSAMKSINEEHLPS